MATNTAQVLPPVRNDPRQVSNTLKKTVNFNDSGVAAGVAFGNSLPSGAFITDCLVEIVTAFNGGTNALTVGTTAGGNNIVNAGDVDETIAAVTRVTRPLGRSLTAAGDIAVFVNYVQTGGAATTGQAIIILVYDHGDTTE